MASPARLNELADHYPPLMGWYRCDESHQSMLRFIGLNLCRDPECFPLRARVRVYSQGAVLEETFSRSLKLESIETLCLNDLIGSVSIEDGYLEVTVFPESEVGLKKNFYLEVWASVYSQTGKLSLNYPLLPSAGTHIDILDASYQYYPGVIVNDRYTTDLLALNQLDFKNEYHLILSSADGERKLNRQFSISPHSLTRHSIEDLIASDKEFFAGKPGLLVFHFKHKMNAYVQTLQRKSGALFGMDHVGRLFTSRGVNNSQSCEQSKRLDDRLVCYCKSVTQAQITQLKTEGHSLTSLQQACGAGTVCQGCLPELRAVMSQSEELL